MGVILIDGPEGAGKTTLIKGALELLPDAQYRHWHQPESYLEYLTALEADVATGAVVFWDRGWPSDAVYGRMLPASTRRFQANEWLGERMLGHRTQLRIILAPRGEILVQRRAERADGKDHPVNPWVESALYQGYGKAYGYLVVEEMDPAALVALIQETTLILR